MPVILAKDRFTSCRPRKRRMRIKSNREYTPEVLYLSERVVSRCILNYVSCGNAADAYGYIACIYPVMLILLLNAAFIGALSILSPYFPSQLVLLGGSGYTWYDH